MKLKSICPTVLSLILLIVLCSSCSNKREKYALKIIDKVEAFYKDNNRLPVNLKEIGLTEAEDSQAHYKLESDSTYIVWYGTSLGESETYHSNTKAWTSQ